MRDFAELATFVTVARAGSFAEAARRLRLSPAMVGRRVQALEARYGARLVERTTRSLRLTTLGQDFLAKAAEILEAVDDLSELANPEQGPLSGRVRVSGPTTLGVRRLAWIVTQLAARWPELSIELVLADRKVDLIGEGFDVAVRVGELRPSGLIARRVGTYRFVAWNRRSGSLMRAAPIGNTRKRAIDPSSSENDPKARQNCSGVAMPNRQRCGQSIGSGSRPA